MKAISQRLLAQALGIDPSAVSRLKKRGMPVSSVEAAAAWRRANVAPYLRTDASLEATPLAAPAAAAPAPDEPAAGAAAGSARLDLAQERAALAREQRIAVELRNAVARGEYARISTLAEVLAAASQAVAERFEHLPGLIKKACPELPPAAIEQVLSTIASARNEWVRQTSALVAQAIVSTEDGDEQAALPTDVDAECYDH